MTIIHDSSAPSFSYETRAERVARVRKLHPKPSTPEEREAKRREWLVGWGNNVPPSHWDEDIREWRMS